MKVRDFQTTTHAALLAVFAGKDLLRHQAHVMNLFSEMTDELLKIEEGSPKPGEVRYIPLDIILTPEVVARIKAYQANEDKVAVIKMIRNEYGIGLKEAKQLVEEVFEGIRCEAIG